MAGDRQVGQNGSTSKEKKLKRKQVLERMKAVDELIKSAYDESDTDPLSAFAPFRSYDRNGLCIRLESASGDKLSLPIKRYIQNLLKLNMEKQYGCEWPSEEKIKRREMVAPEARYLFALEPQAVCATQGSGQQEKEMDDSCTVESKSAIVGFVHYRFTVEEDVPVLYVYELQLEPRVQGKGLGKFLMQLIELIAHKKHMSAVVLTVQTENLTAMRFYLSKLRYNISSISPSQVGVEKNYEILCKAFDIEAKERLESGCTTYLGIPKVKIAQNN
uniref:N-alpha-acetyltransferase 40 n=1 Tax=Kalanchoe fedtschenkoi TaxID=63787 RepID=A0A7N0T2V7_KALFE